MIATIIVTYNGMRNGWIKKCIDSIINSSTYSKIIVIDNNSSDSTVAFIKENYSSVLLIESKTNLGFGGANNIGIKKGLDLGAEYFFLINQDAWVENQTIEILMKKAIKLGYGILSPLQFNSDGSKFDRNFKSLLNESNCPGFIEDLFFNKLKEVYDIKFVMAAFWLISRKTINQIGLFNPVFSHYGEDDDYLNRAKYHKINIGIVPETHGFHDREFRKLEFSQIIYLKYTSYLAEINNLSNSTYYSALKVSFIFMYSILSHLLSMNFKKCQIEIGHFTKIILKKLFISIKMKKQNRNITYII